jgi:hypothetical protein
MTTATQNPTTVKHASTAFTAYQKALLHVATLGGFHVGAEAIGVRDGVGDEGKPEGKEVLIRFDSNAGVRTSAFVGTALRLIQENTQLPSYVQE